MNKEDKDSFRWKHICVPFLSRFRPVSALTLVAALLVGAKAHSDSAKPETPRKPISANGAIAPINAPFPMPQLQRPVFPDRTFNITNYGAVGDGVTKNTRAIADAISACVKAGGGKVIVPAGKWLTGAIHLKSRVNLHMAEDAEIHFSDEPADYLPVVFTRWAGYEVMNYSPLIYATGCENIAITGPGKLYGHGQKWWPWSKRLDERDKVAPLLESFGQKHTPVAQRVFGNPDTGLRPQFISPIHCTNVLLEGFTIAEPGPFWTIHLVYCENVIARGLTILTKQKPGEPKPPNTDGLNLDSSRNVLVEDCFFDVGDDAVCLKSGINEDGRRVGRATENVVVRHVTAHWCHGGIVIGSEMSGGVRNVLAQDCLFDGSNVGIRLKSNAARGGVVENIHYRDITMRDIKTEAIQLVTDYGAWGAAGNATNYPLFRNIFIRNVTCDGAAGAANVQATTHQPIQTLELDAVSIKAKTGMQFNWVQGLRLRNVKCTPVSGEPISIRNCEAVERTSVDQRSPSRETARAAARARPRRLLFNDDGGDARVPPVPLPKPRDFLSLRIAPLAGTHVDTVVFDTTSGTFNRFAHRTQVAEMFLQREGRYQHNILPDLAPLGTDPLRVVTEHCRTTGQEVFWTMRMNDTHDSGNPLLIPQLKIDHPDWLMGTKDRPPKRGAWSAVDYGQPEVRDLARRTIAEVAANYDLDGIALDFWRHPVYFRKTAAEQPVDDEERALMTALLRDVRHDLDAAGRRRGRYVLLAIKVPDSAGYCREIGLDLERWLADGLIDLLVSGGYFQLDHWPGSVALARRHGVKIIACLSESRVRDEDGKKARASLESLRARALQAWAAGVDGIEMFNHFDPQSPLWRELGDPALLRTLPKIYFASVQGSGQGRSYYPAGDHFKLPTLTPDAPQVLTAGTRRTYELFVGDDLRRHPEHRARLMLRVGAGTASAPLVHWNDQRLPISGRDQRIWSAALDSTWVTPGLHRITITSQDDLQLEDLSLRID